MPNPRSHSGRGRDWRGPKTRALVTESFAKGLSVKETAQVVGVTRQAVSEHKRALESKPKRRRRSRSSLTTGKRPVSPSFDILETDGGWLTSEGVAVAGGLNPKSVNRSLYRWRKRGFVESRLIELSLNRSGTRPARIDTRTEWRVV